MAVKPPEIVNELRAVGAGNTTPEHALRNILMQSLQPLHREAYTIVQRLAAHRETFSSVEVLDEMPNTTRPSRTHMALVMAQLEDLGLIRQVGNVKRLKVYRLPEWMRNTPPV